MADSERKQDEQRALHIGLPDCVGSVLSSVTCSRFLYQPE
jgi:hypothetical protein